MHRAIFESLCERLRNCFPANEIDVSVERMLIRPHGSSSRFEVLPGQSESQVRIAFGPVPGTGRAFKIHWFLQCINCAGKYVWKVTENIAHNPRGWNPCFKKNDEWHLRYEDITPCIISKLQQLSSESDWR